MSTAGMHVVNEYSQRQIVSISETEIADNATLAPTPTPLAAGTILGVITDNRTLAPYKNDASNGTEVAKAILAESVDASTLPQQVAVYIAGVFYKHMLIGLDEAAVTDMKMRETINDQVIF